MMRVVCIFLIFALARSQAGELEKTTVCYLILSITKLVQNVKGIQQKRPRLFGCRLYWLNRPLCSISMHRADTSVPAHKKNKDKERGKKRLC